MLDLTGQQLGNYRLVDLLGQGGFADVYLAEHIFLRTQAAVKVLHAAQMIPQAVQSFIKEAQTIARLKHPHIVSVLDFGIERSTLFLVMEYVPNGTLHQRHPDGSVLSVATLLSYVRQVAAALQYAHDNKLVHRDIKPENMLVAANNTILLSDFGLAVTAHRAQSLSLQELYGTLQYMAPEHIEGKARPASDQYSLGIVVYKWLCGRYPFDGATEIEIVMKHLYDPPPPLRGMLPALSTAMEAVVLRALAKDPNQRFANVQDFANALEDACQKRHLPGQLSTNRAMISQTNPYVPWGKLVLDSTSSKPFTYRNGYLIQIKRFARRFSNQEFFGEKDHVLHYTGDGCSLTNTRPDSLMRAMIENSTFSDFAFQVEITPVSHQALPGVVFRSDHKGRQGYVFCVSVNTNESTVTKVKYFLEFIEGASRHRLAQDMFTLNQHRKQSYLLGIVAQGPSIDLYFDLKHVTHLDDYTCKQGAIGIALYRAPFQRNEEATFRGIGSSSTVKVMTAKFSRAKVWIP